jgi:hypothetical protein
MSGLILPHVVRYDVSNLEQGYVAGQNKEVTGYYDITFMITFFGENDGVRRNIFQISGGDSGPGDCCEYGLRYPALYLHPYENRNTLEWVYGTSNDGNASVVLDNFEFVADVQYSVRMAMEDGGDDPDTASITVDGHTVWSDTITAEDRPSFDNAAVYMSSPYHPPANALLQLFIFTYQ